MCLRLKGRFFHRRGGSSSAPRQIAGHRPGGTGGAAPEIAQEVTALSEPAVINELSGQNYLTGHWPERIFASEDTPLPLTVDEAEGGTI